MTDITSKLFAVVIAFVLSVLTPYAITAEVEDMVAQRSIMNEMTMFIDEVIDTGKITDSQLADFQLGCNSYGPIVQIEISKQVKVVNPDPVNGGTYTTYIRSDNIDHFNQGDQVQVRVFTVGYTGNQRLVLNLLKIVYPSFDCTFSGRVR